MGSLEAQHALIHIHIPAPVPPFRLLSPAYDQISDFERVGYSFLEEPLRNRLTLVKNQEYPMVGILCLE